MVSFSVSPLLWLVLEASENPMTLAPSLLTAVSKLRRVLVEGSKKRLPMTFPSRNFCSLFFSNSLAVSKTCRISSLLKSWIEIKLLLISVIIALPQGRFYSSNTASQPSVSLILLRKSSSWERR